VTSVVPFVRKSPSFSSPLIPLTPALSRGEGVWGAFWGVFYHFLRAPSSEDCSTRIPAKAPQGEGANGGEKLGGGRDPKSTIKKGKPQSTQRGVAATKIQTPDTRPQTSDRKANHRGHRERNAEGTEYRDELNVSFFKWMSFSMFSVVWRWFWGIQGVCPSPVSVIRSPQISGKEGKESW
jgi:hypothetical protein